MAWAAPLTSLSTTAGMTRVQPAVGQTKPAATG